MSDETPTNKNDEPQEKAADSQSSIHEVIHESKTISSDDDIPEVGSQEFLLELYKGPLDLLLHLIKKHEVDIYDIPITLIANQYMDYIKDMQIVNIELGGEFLVMAATLMDIKARMLMPAEVLEVRADTEEDDPRESLVRQLLEYKRFKEASRALEKKGEDFHERFSRGKSWMPKADVVDPADLPVNAEISDLFYAFEKLMSEIGPLREISTTVTNEEIPIEQHIDFVLNSLNKNKRTSLRALLFNSNEKHKIPTRIEFTGCFLAILELCKRRDILVTQGEGSKVGDIYIEARAENYEDPIPEETEERIEAVRKRRPSKFAEIITEESLAKLEAEETAKEANAIANLDEIADVNIDIKRELVESVRGDMRYRILGKTEIEISAIGFGVSKNIEWNQNSIKKVAATAHKAIDSGVTLIDFTNVPRDVITEIMKTEKKFSVISVATVPEGIQAENALEKTLEITGLERIDILLFTDQTTDDKLKEAIDALPKSTFAGFCATSPRAAQVALETGLFAVARIEFSILYQYHRLRTLRACAHLNVGVLASSTLCGGNFEDVIDTRDTLRDALDEHEGSYGQTALRYVISYPEITSAITATTNNLHIIEATASGARGVLPEESVRIIERDWEIYAEEIVDAQPTAWEDKKQIEEEEGGVNNEEQNNEETQSDDIEYVEQDDDEELIPLDASFESETEEASTPDEDIYDDATHEKKEGEN